MTLRLLAAAALALALPAAPAAAATVSPLKPCYVSAGPAEKERERVVVTGSGFSPDATVEILVDGLLVLEPRTGSLGEFEAYVNAPHQRSGERAFSVVVRDPREPAGAITLGSRVTKLGVSMRPRKASPSRRVRVRGRGFTRSRPVFAHYLYGDEHKRTVRLARRTRSSCGAFRVRRRQLPIAQPRAGTWTVQIDQRRRYDARPRPVWVRVPIEVTRTFAIP